MRNSFHSTMDTEKSHCHWKFIFFNRFRWRSTSRYQCAIYDVTLWMCDNTGNLITWCRIAIQMKLYNGYRCIGTGWGHQVKLIDKLIVGDNAGNHFETPQPRPSIKELRLVNTIFIDAAYEYAWGAYLATVAAFSFTHLNELLLYIFSLTRAT